MRFEVFKVSEFRLELDFFEGLFDNDWDNDGSLMINQKYKILLV